ncbi:MAG: YdeI/OmpD-associated family protein [Zoogloeaceae bacterium]|nr:YdeI/OmpD-associated family protein [Rhodocyclaceae bacterium]MCP5234731.1 YdeI/OmpD-associated family protein [Zoogloeaceae bacterium]
MMEAIVVSTQVARKAPTLPRYVEIPACEVHPWHLVGTTAVVVEVGGVELGRRNLKRWGKGRDCWFIDLPEAWCRRARIATGDRVSVRLRRAGDALPDELAALLSSDPVARDRWDALTASRQRALADHVRNAKRPQTRSRRAAVLSGAATP